MSWGRTVSWSRRRSKRNRKRECSRDRRAGESRTFPFSPRSLCPSGPGDPRSAPRSLSRGRCRWTRRSRRPISFPTSRRRRPPCARPKRESSRRVDCPRRPSPSRPARSPRRSRTSSPCPCPGLVAARRSMSRRPRAAIVGTDREAVRLMARRALRLAWFNVAAREDMAKAAADRAARVKATFDAVAGAL